MDAFQVIGDRYRLQHSIGQGAYGEVWQAMDLHTKTLVAVKIESRIQLSSSHTLSQERDILHKVRGLGIPQVLSLYETSTATYLVQQLLGPNLLQLSQNGIQKTEFIDYLLQALMRVKHLHSRGFIHKDIKPQNFCVNVSKNTLYLIDFGMAGKYVTGRGNVHIQYKENVPFAGTYCFASLNVLMGVHPTRRDDLESLLMVAIRLLRGRLPWEGLASPSAKCACHMAVKRAKLLITIHELCCGLPKSLKTALEYVRSLAFAQDPDYEYLKTCVLQMNSEIQDFEELTGCAMAGGPPQKSVTLGRKAMKSKKRTTVMPMFRKVGIGLTVGVRETPCKPDSLDDSPSLDGETTSEDECTKTIETKQYPTLPSKFLPNFTLL